MALLLAMLDGALIYIRIALERLCTSVRVLSISEMMALRDCPRCPRWFSACQNSSSSVMLVAWPAILTERFFICLPHFSMAFLRASIAGVQCRVYVTLSKMALVEQRFNP